MITKSQKEKSPVSTSCEDKYWNAKVYLSKAGLCATVGNRPDQSPKMAHNTFDFFVDCGIQQDDTKPSRSVNSCATSLPIDTRIVRRTGMRVFAGIADGMLGATCGRASSTLFQFSGVV